MKYFFPCFSLLTEKQINRASFYLKFSLERMVKGKESSMDFFFML